MFRSIVVPLDGSPLAARAIPYAALFAEPDARIALIGVVEPPINDHFFVTRADQIAEEMGFATEILWQEVEARAAPLRARGFHVVTTVLKGGATGEIIGFAHDERADLIAMSTHGTGGLSRWMLGSVTNRVLHATQTPVLVVRTKPGDKQLDIPTIGEIVVPLDGSAFAEDSLLIARELASRLALPIRLIGVVDNASALFHPYPMNDLTAVRRLTVALENARAKAEEYMHDVRSRCASDAYSVDAAVHVGDPATVLADELAARPNALAIMATHGTSSGDQGAFGSVTEKIVTAVPNPTLVLHPATLRPEVAVQEGHTRDTAVAVRNPD